MDSDAVGWTTLLTSGRVTDKACRVWGFLVTPSAGSSMVTIYDGLDAGSGRYFLALTQPWTVSAPYLFPKPVQFDSGVYVDFTTSITAVMVLWEPVS